MKFGYRWRFGFLVLLAFCGSFYTLQQYQQIPQEWQSYGTGVAMAVLFWSMAVGGFLLAGTDHKTRDLIDCFREEDRFRNLIWGHGLALLLCSFVVQTPMDAQLRDPKVWPGMLFLFALFMLTIYRIGKYLQKDSPEEDLDLPLFARRLKKILIYFSAIALPLLLLPFKLTLENLLSERSFCLWVTPVCGLLAAGLAYLLPRFFPEETNERFKSEFRLTAWVILFLSSLSGSAVFNQWAAPPQTRMEKLQVAPNGFEAKKPYLWLHVDGKYRRFSPPWDQWKDIRQQDSLPVSIRSGALGFDFIEKFGGTPQ